MKNSIFLFAAVVSLLVPSLTAKAQSLTSPDGKWLVFVKPVPGPGIETGIGNDEAPSELWQVDSKGRHSTLLVRCRNSEENDMRQVIAGFHDLRSPRTDDWFISPRSPGQPLEPFTSWILPLVGNTSSVLGGSRVSVVIIW